MVEITTKNIKKVADSTLIEKFIENDRLLKELKAMDKMLKDEIMRRSEFSDNDYLSKDGLHTVTYRVTEETTQFDTDKAKELIPNWKEVCVKAKAGSHTVKVNALKIKRK